jgi:probable addiction module antidote protein
VGAALGDIAWAKGMARIARETGLGRESLYKALSLEGNPEFATALKEVRALGLRRRATPGPASITRRQPRKAGCAALSRYRP